MRTFSDDPKKNAHILRALSAKEEDLVDKARKLAGSLAGAFKRKEGKDLGDKDHKERQLRNIQAVAEQSPSWAPVELFIRYQAARKEIYASWAQEAIKTLADLKTEAESVVSGKDAQLVNNVHMELLRRLLGYLVRWHVWDAKGKTQLAGG